MKRLNFIILLAISAMFFSCERNEPENRPEQSTLQRAEIIFDKTFPDISDVHRIRLNSNDDIFIFGSSSVVKIDRNGNKKWSIPQGAIDLAPTSDGGCVIVSVRGTSFFNRVFYLIKICSEGNIEWERSGANYQLSRIIVGSNDEIFGIGDIGVEHRAQPKFFKYTKDGDYLFSSFLTETRWESYQTISMLKLNNNNFVIGTLNSVSTDRQNFDFNIIEFDINANVILERNYGGFRNEFLTDITETPDDGLILVGITDSRDGDIKSWRDELSLDNGGNAWIVRLDENREIKWEKVMGGADTSASTWFAKSFYGSNKILVAFQTSATDLDFKGLETRNTAGYITFDTAGNVLNIRHIESSMVWSGTGSCVFDSQGNLVILSMIHDDYFMTDTPRLIKIR